MIALALSLAFGQVDPQSEAVRLAEYQRLSESLHSYAARQAWPAVEQAYVRCEATGAPMSMADHLQGAYSARMRGDITAVRKRLLAILALGTDRDAIEWLWSIDQTYSAVTIKGYPGAELIPRERPFDPIQGL